MAASAYAALVSLSRLLKQVLHPSKQHWIRLDRDQIMSLDNKVGFLVDLLEKLSNIRSSSKYVTDELMNQMASAGHEAEDIIDSYVAKIFCADDDSAEVENRIRELSNHFCEDIKRVTQTMDLINQNLIQIQNKMDDDHHVDDHLSQHMTVGDDVLSTRRADPTRSSKSVKNVVMVGFEDQVHKMIGKLANTAESKLQVIPIVGMGGLGKTTLAKHIYEKSIIVDYFHARAWVTLSQSFTIREVFLTLLGKKEMSGKTDEELGEEFRKSLFGRRYLIVIDDIWTTEDWDKFKRFFPDNKNGSRIMITTRLSNVANSLGSADNSHQLKFLDKDDSWNLFCQKVFQGQGCPPHFELEEIGRKIAKSCGGLPLAIVAIGGLLAKSSKTPEYWEYVAENLNSIINSGDDDYCLKLLSLSYNDLPVHLKPCFLYMAMFPEDREIDVNRLVRLWVAEGFLKPTKDEDLEDAGKVYLNELIERNLILVGKLGKRTGRMKRCKIHDVLRDLCIREAEKESFLCVMKADSKIDNNILQGIKSTRRLAIHQNNTDKPSNYTEEDLINALKCATNARTLVSEFEWISTCVVPGLGLNLVRVLDVVDDKYSLEEIKKLSSLRYGSFYTDFMFPQWNLQTFVCSDIDADVVKMPSRIWEMTELRHIKCSFVLPDPTPTRESEIMENLQTLEIVNNLRLSEEVVKRVPNLRRLRIYYGDDDDYDEDGGEEWGTYYGINNLVHFHKLESLILYMEDIDKVVIRNISFPSSLKELFLVGCGLPWSDMKAVASLPQLESLQILNAFVGTTWDATTDDQGKFVQLKYLRLQSDDLMYWITEKTHFPMLEKLYLYCDELEGIPLGFAEVPTLELIQLQECKPSAMNSAREILEERDGLGYEGLQIQYYDKEEYCYKKVEMDGDEDD